MLLLATICFSKTVSTLYSKFGLSEKHTKFEKTLPHGFDKSADLLSKRQNPEEDFIKLCPNFTHLTYITLKNFKEEQKKSGARPKRLQLSKDQITSSQRVILIYKLVWDWNKWAVHQEISSVFLYFWMGWENYHIIAKLYTLLLSQSKFRYSEKATKICLISHI